MRTIAFTTRCASAEGLRGGRQTMKSILCVSLLILLMPSAYAASLPGDSADGKRLYDANCMGCHDTSVFTRKDRVVQSLDALKKQVVSSSHAAKKELSGTFECTTVLAAITVPLPISTPIRMAQFPPIQEPNPIFIGADLSAPYL